MSIIPSGCASCGDRLGASDETCRSCGAAVAPATHPLYGVVSRAAQHEQDGSGRIVVTTRDFMVLEELARLRLRPDDPARHALLDALEQCQVVPPDKVAAEVVTLDSRVVFRVDAGTAEERVVGLPDAHGVPGWSLPVTTPRGLAMLGLRAGSTIISHRRDGSSERIEILSVPYQPEQAARGWRAQSGGDDPPPAA